MYRHKLYAHDFSLQLLATCLCYYKRSFEFILVLCCKFFYFFNKLLCVKNKRIKYFHSINCFWFVFHFINDGCILMIYSQLSFSISILVRLSLLYQWWLHVNDIFSIVYLYFHFGSSFTSPTMVVHDIFPIYEIQKISS